MYLHTYRLYSICRNKKFHNIISFIFYRLLCKYTVRSESRCALRLRYVDLFVNIEVAVEVCCCFAVFSC
jgi:hypothetical protein